MKKNETGSNDPESAKNISFNDEERAESADRLQHETLKRNKGIERFSAQANKQRFDREITYLKDLKLNNDQLVSVFEQLVFCKLPKNFNLDLSGNALSDAGIDRIVSILMKSFKDFPENLIVNFSRNSIGTDGAQSLAALINSGKYPEGFTLHLAENFIDAKGSKEIEDALQKNQRKDLFIVGLHQSNRSNSVSKTNKYGFYEAAPRVADQSEAHQVLPLKK